MTIFLTILMSFFSLSAAEYSIDQQSGVAIPNFLGELKMAKGIVSKVQNDREVPVKLGARFFPKDTIVTGDKAFARIIMADDTVLNLGANSRLTFTEFEITRKTERKFDFNLQQGRLRSQVKNKAQEGDLTIRTPLATMGIRGTELLINHRIENGVAISQMALMSGHVEIKSAQGENFELKQGDGLVFVHDSKKNQSAQDAVKLTGEEWALLANSQELLPFYLLKNAPETSALHPFASNLNATGEQKNQDSVEEKILPTQPSTNDNLRKLNEQLKDEYLKNKSN